MIVVHVCKHDMIMHIHVLRQLIFLWKVTALGVLCCLFDLACSSFCISH